MSGTVTEWRTTSRAATGATAGEARAACDLPRAAVATARCHAATAPGHAATAPDAGTPQLGAGAARRRWRLPRPGRVPARLTAACAATPFAVGYALVLIATSLFVGFGDPGTVDSALNGSSTDVSHLAERPLVVLPASAVWVAGGMFLPFIALFVLVVGALERRVGGLRAAGVFLLGHVTATMLTELPVAVSVAVGHLPGSSLRRLDYGISYGLLACTAALAALLRPRARLPLLVAVGAVLAVALVRLNDPLTDWGHLLALLTGLACWPYVRGTAARRAAAQGAAAQGAAGR